METRTTYSVRASARQCLKTTLVVVLGFAVAVGGTASLALAQPLPGDAYLEVYPTGYSGEDLVNVQWAADNIQPGGTVVLRSTDTSGSPQPFNFGDSGSVVIGKTVTITGDGRHDNGDPKTKILGGYAPIVIQTGGNDVQIRDIHLDQPSFVAIVVGDIEGGGPGPQGVVIESNKITGAAYGCILLTGESAGNEVKGCDLGDPEDPEGFDVCVQVLGYSHDNLILENRFGGDLGECAIDCHGSSNTFIDNVFTGAGDYGWKVEGEASNNVFQGNDLTGFVPTYANAELDPGTQDNSFVENRFGGGGVCAIDCRGSNNTFQNNDYVGGGLYGWKGSGEANNNVVREDNLADFVAEVAHVYLGPATYDNLFVGLSDVAIIDLGQNNSFALGATIDVEPDTFNLKSKAKWVTCYIELGGDYDVMDIDGATVILEDIAAHIGREDWARPEANTSNVLDHDGDGILERMVKFERSLVQDYLIGVGLSDYVDLTVTGQLTDGGRFEGIDMIRIIDEDN